MPRRARSSRSACARRSAAGRVPLLATALARGALRRRDARRSTRCRSACDQPARALAERDRRGRAGRPSTTLSRTQREHLRSRQLLGRSAAVEQGRRPSSSSTRWTRLRARRARRRVRGRSAAEQSNTSVVLRRAAGAEGLPPARARASTPSWRCCGSSPSAASRTSPSFSAGTSTAASSSSATLGVAPALRRRRASTAGSWRSRRAGGERPRIRWARLAELGTRERASCTPCSAPTPATRLRARGADQEALALRTATIDERDRAGLLRAARRSSADEPIAGRGEEVREHVRCWRKAASAGRLIRTHGDLHLGQTMLAPTGLADRRLRGRAGASADRAPTQALPLRDVAGMLRSFAYAAGRGRAAARGQVAGRLRAAGARERSSTVTGDAVDPAAALRGQPTLERPAGVLRAREGRLRAALRARPPPGLGARSRSPGSRACSSE